MKTVFIILIPLMVFIGASSMAISSVNREAEKMNRDIQNIETSVNGEKWKMAETGLKGVNKEWESVRKKWKALIDHAEVDRIDASLARIGELVKMKEKKDCMAEIAVLKQSILHIPEKEKLSLSNIF